MAFPCREARLSVGPGTLGSDQLGAGCPTCAICDCDADDSVLFPPRPHAASTHATASANRAGVRSLRELSPIGGEADRLKVEPHLLDEFASLAEKPLFANVPQVAQRELAAVDCGLKIAQPGLDGALVSAKMRIVADRDQGCMVAAVIAGNR